jgi:hypothetical protein
VFCSSNNLITGNEISGNMEGGILICDAQAQGSSPSSAANRVGVGPRPFSIPFLHYIAHTTAGSAVARRYRFK